LSVGDDHSGELSAATVRTGLAVSTETSDEGKIKGELVLEPVDSISRTASKDTDQIVAGEVASRFLGISEEGLSGIRDVEKALAPCSGTVDTGSSLGRVTTHERLLVEKENTSATLEKSVGSGETGETATNDNNLGHL